MAKYYVESGDLRVVVQAAGPIPAAAKALAWTTDQDNLDVYVTVNERGFIGDRPDRQRHQEDVLLETGTLISLICEHDFA